MSDDHPLADKNGDSEYAPTPEALERGRLLFSQPCVFLRGAVAMDQLPDPDLTEVAFAGRSNAGKSSLLNALTGRTDLARTSNTPGRTQEINFFLLGSPRHGYLRLVDLPGYGYAKVEKAKSERWRKALRAYLRGRPNLRRVMVLIDARHGVKPGDDSVMALMDEAAVSYQVVLTKADKTKEKELNARLTATARALRRHPAAHPQILVTSSVKKTGLEAVRAALADFAGPGSSNIPNQSA